MLAGAIGSPREDSLDPAGTGRAGSMWGPYGLPASVQPIPCGVTRWLPSCSRESTAPALHGCLLGRPLSVSLRRMDRGAGRPGNHRRVQRRQLLPAEHDDARADGCVPREDLRPAIGTCPGFLPPARAGYDDAATL